MHTKNCFTFKRLFWTSRPSKLATITYPISLWAYVFFRAGGEGKCSNQYK